MANYSFKTSGLPIPGDRVIETCNFCQLVPHTAIYAGESSLTFRNCNLTNCDVPGDSVIDRCLRVQVEFCSNLHPKWIEKGLATCTENCAHVTSTDIIQVGGVTVETIYTYEDKAVS
jgi:hypothetical protein